MQAERVPDAYLSVDLEDAHEGHWFPEGVFKDACAWSAERQTRRLLVLLEEYGARATFFVTLPLLDRFPALVRELAGLGHEVAVHGHRHLLAYDLSRDAFREGLVEAKAQLEQVVGQAILGYRAPSWSIVRRNAGILDELRDLGFVYDSSIFPASNFRFGVAGAPRRPYRLPNGLVEIPPSTAALGPIVVPFGGGFYLRLIPRPILVALAAAELRRHPLVLYVHPWELEPDPDRHIPLPALDRFVRTWAVDTAERKLRSLLALAPHRPFREAHWLEKIDLPVVDPFSSAPRRAYARRPRIR